MSPKSTTTQSSQTTRQRNRKRNSFTASNKNKARGISNDDLQPNKDRFIDLAQAALEEADIEEERKGVIHEVMEALIAKTGAPLVAEVISEQLRVQDVIERIAEHHEEERKRLNESPLISRIDSTDSIDSLKEPDEECVQEEKKMENSSNDDKRSTISPAVEEEPTFTVIAEYLWRLFRVLILSSLVGLVYHFLSNDVNEILKS